MSTQEEAEDNDIKLPLSGLREIFIKSQNELKFAEESDSDQSLSTSND